MRNLWIDGKNLRDFGVIVSGENSFDSAEWQYEKQEIPGRNGDLLIPQKRFANISVKYPAFIMRDFAKKVPELRNFLLSAGAAYRKIEDDYYPKTYRLGIFSGPLSFEAGFLNKTGRMNLVFDCKPQRFLKSGNFPVKVSNGQELHNAWMPAHPLIRVTGTGDGILTVGKSTVGIIGINGEIMLDCDIQNAYSGTINRNNSITITGGWPVLSTGQTIISFSGGITDVEITARWWTV